jgi:hypothetical protein
MISNCFNQDDLYSKGAKPPALLIVFDWTIFLLLISFKVPNHYNVISFWRIQKNKLGWILIRNPVVGHIKFLLKYLISLESWSKTIKIFRLGMAVLCFLSIFVFRYREFLNHHSIHNNFYIGFCNGRVSFLR